MPNRIQPPLGRTLAALLLICLLRIPALAAGSAGFSVRPILPDNQVPETKGFFDLRVEPGQSQDLEILIVNRDSTDIAVTLNTVTASTNENGIVNYTTAGPMDETLVHSFADISAVTEDELIVPANSSIRTVVHIDVPEEPFPGLLLGSVQVLRSLSEEDIRSADMIVNQYSYVIGIRLNEDGAVPPPDFALGEVAADLANGRASVCAQVRNTQPSLVKGMEAAMRVTSKEDGTVVFEKRMDDVDVAPNSVFPFTISDQAGYGVRAGTYLANIHLQYQGETWELEKEFEIAPAQARAINSGAVNQSQQQPSPGASSILPVWAIVCGISLLAAIVVLLALLLLRTRKKQPAAQCPSATEE